MVMNNDAQLIWETYQEGHTIIHKNIDGFRPLHTNEKWHIPYDRIGNADLAMLLPDGWRPLLVGEPIHKGDQIWYGELNPSLGWRLAQGHPDGYRIRGTEQFYRTQRPLQ